ncbi:MarR family winged helix-turn-helix transcriptional regulator [Tahibacter amnicola]|uniref:MarR family transcriptional regulator n=1 Tax=Tahibacter amnicola TaxID=2976241 RepID=A0ABY6BM55_9GAMM|nr:MarR family transcriptional regulator [Tahibacter amnicola]UXI68892.1 MarR family transcriptional regulator [Tahibacter amnicola]
MPSSDHRAAILVPLFDVTRLLRTRFDRRAEPLGLTRAQWRALRFIDSEPGITQKMLAERLEMEPIPVGRVVDRLVMAQFVERRADPADRRCWRLHITAKAHGITGKMDVIADGLCDDTFAGVAEADVAVFRRVVDQMKQNLLALDLPPVDSDA